LQHVAILPIGSVNITNDLAIGLRTDLDIAETIKVKHAAAVLHSSHEDPKDVEVTHGNDKLVFGSQDIDMIVEARLDEIFELVDKELRHIDRAGKLPGGVILTGGGANLRGIEEYAKEKLSLPVRVAKLNGLTGIVDKISGPEFATCLGLMLLDLEQEASVQHVAGKALQHKAVQTGGKLLQNVMQHGNSLFKKFKI